MADPGEIPPALRYMVGEVVSNAAGCRYWAAHNAENAAERGGVAGEKINALWQFKTNPDGRRECAQNSCESRVSATLKSTRSA